MARKTKSGVGMGRKSIDPKYKFGTQEDIDNRNDTGYRRPPEAHPSHFTQIQPSSSGQDLNRPATPTKSGNIKFARGDF